MKVISKLHFITASAPQAEQACRGGADWIQLRIKNATWQQYYSVAMEVKTICSRYGATFIINDNVELAQRVGANGVHIGKEDMHPETARKQLGDSFIIGCTANTIDDLIKLSPMPIDYIGLGPFRFTNTKEKLSPILGIDGYNAIFQQLTQKQIALQPIVGIGGIALPDVADLLLIGLHGVAVSGAIANAQDIADTTQKFRKSIYYQLQS